MAINKHTSNRLTRGFTLVELMITIAIISIIAAIAIPAYNGYILEARLSTARSNMDSLRLFLEDYRLDNGTYVGPSGASPSLAQIDSDFGWTPDGDSGAYTYTLTLTANSYNIAVQTDDTWVRCEDRMSNCCDSTMSGATNATNACP